LRALLDTHVFLWWTTDNRKLSARAHDFIVDPDNSFSLSVVSAWEILLKARTGRLPIPGDAAKYVEEHPQIDGFTFSTCTSRP
jgi:PIN domain nuclease of toxin-antitoxin system